MSLVIRLSKTGKRGERKFRIVVSEKRARRDGRAIETLGYFEKGTEKGAKEANRERYSHWLSQGAKPSKTVSEIFNK